MFRNNNKSAKKQTTKMFKNTENYTCIITDTGEFIFVPQAIDEAVEKAAGFLWGTAPTTKQH